MADRHTLIDKQISRRTTLAALGGLTTAGLAGCLGGASSSDSDLSGSIRISGSSTVFPISEAAGEEFKRDHSDVEISVSSDGSTGGFNQHFIPGESDINGASRPILDEELERIHDNGFDVIELQCAGDALTAVVNNDNDWVDCMTFDELRQIWHPDEDNERWSDVNPEWPDEPFELYGPATTSGTFDYWTEEVVNDFRRIRDDFHGTEEDDIIAQGVAGNPYAHGYLPYAYYDNNPDTVKALAVDPGSGCATPSLEAASEGTYPLARPIFWYVNTEKLSEKEHLQAFIKDAVELSGNHDIIAEDIGYVPMNEDQVEENLQKIEDAI